MDWQSTRIWKASLPVINRLMVAWLRSRWHGPVSSSMMVLTFEGARTGKTYSFPVGYTEDGEGLVTFTRFGWWKNFRTERPVSLTLRGREARGVAVAVRDPEVVAERLAYYLGRNPHDGRYFGVRVGRDGRTDPEDLSRAASRLVVIRTSPRDAPTDGGNRARPQEQVCVGRWPDTRPNTVHHEAGKAHIPRQGLFGGGSRG